jgi:hypothetical protein
LTKPTLFNQVCFHTSSSSILYRLELKGEW